MDPKYLPAFDNRINLIRQNDPFAWVHAMINEVGSETLGATNLSLRADGILFLLVNIVNLIVMPWDNTEGTDFRASHEGPLREDVRDIITDAQGIATARGVNEISAHTLFQATANRLDALRLLAANLWS